MLKFKSKYGRVIKAMQPFPRGNIERELVPTLLLLKRVDEYLDSPTQCLKGSDSPASGQKFARTLNKLVVLETPCGLISIIITIISVSGNNSSTILPHGAKKVSVRQTQYPENWNQNSLLDTHLTYPISGGNHAS